MQQHSVAVISTPGFVFTPGLVQVPAWKQSQAALALAQLHLDSGAPQAAQHALSMLHQPTEPDDGQPHQPDAHQAQALYQHADLLLQLDQQVCLLSCHQPAVHLPETSSTQAPASSGCVMTASSTGCKLEHYQS